MRSRMLRAKKKAAAAVSFVGAYYDDAPGATVTFSGISVPAGLIVVVLHVDFSPHSLTSLTIGGTEATSVVLGSVGGAQRADMRCRRIASPSTIDVVATFDNATSRCAISVWCITGNTSDTPAATHGSVVSAGTTVTASLSSLPSRSVCVAGVSHGTGGSTITFTGATERYDSNREAGGSQFAGADTSNVSGTHDITADFSTGTLAIAAAGWA